jgi:hypothetical protein
LPLTGTINSGQVVDLYLAVEDNGMFDLDVTSSVILDPLVLGQIETQTSPPETEPSDPSPTGSSGGGGGCFINTLWR